MKTNRTFLWMGVSSALTLSLATAFLLMQPKRPPASPERVYSSEGFGGYVGARGLAPEPGKHSAAFSAKRAYKEGRYRDAETLARETIALYGDSSDLALRKEAVMARLTLGYAIAGRKEFREAREAFLETKRAASELPDHGALTPALGEVRANLEEEASFQAVVCTGAMGEKREAMTEYSEFLEEYPDSILIHAAIKRVTFLNGGDIPPGAEKLWLKAMEKQKALKKQQDRKDAMCAPACLAELLRRKGKPVSIEALAKEMKTDENGTSLSALSDAAKKKGFHPQGLQVTEAGLRKQPLPAIAFVGPGHFVLVEKLTQDRIYVWDPGMKEGGPPAAMDYSLSAWKQRWSGVLLTL